MLRTLMTTIIFVLALSFVANLISCDFGSDDSGDVCSLMGCSTLVRVRINSIKPNDYRVSLILEESDREILVSCSVFADSVSCSSDSFVDASYSDGSLLLLVDAYVSEPTDISVGLYRDDALIDEWLISPSYEAFYPDGPKCGIGCYTVSEEVVETSVAIQ